MQDDKGQAAQPIKYAPLPIDDFKLEAVAELAQQQIIMEHLVTTLDDQLKKAKEGLRKLSEEIFPAKMFELGVAAFTLKDGSKITVKPFYQASISEEKRDQAHRWLEENGHGSLIKALVAVEFGKDSKEDQTKAFTLLAEAGFMPTKKESVHSSTLKAFVKEQMESGKVLPDSISTHVGNKTTVQIAAPQPEK